MRGRDYAELRMLSRIAHHKSFVRAAKELQITPSALSQTIRALEARLGVRLLHRTTRSVAPSETGARLLARLTPVFEELDAALSEVSEEQHRGGGVVRLNAPGGMTLRFIGPRLGAFARAHPQVVLDLTSEDRITDIVAGGYDAGIRLGERLEKDMVAVKLGGEQQQVAVASPAYIARHGMPRTPHELTQHRCINMRMPSDGSLYRWEFERRRKRLEISVEGPLIVSDPQLALLAALQGMGIAYLFREHVAGALASGKLVPMLESWSPPFAGFYLYYPGRRHVRPPLRALIDFLRRELQPGR